MKLLKQLMVASSMLFALTAFAQVNVPAAPAGAHASPAVPDAPRASSVVDASQKAGTASTRERGAATTDSKAEAAAQARMDARKSALAPSAGVGARMETDMSVRR